MDTIKVSAVVPFHHANDHLVQLTRDCLYSIKGQFDELVMVDDASPLKGSEFMSQADIFIQNFTNLGYIKSANKGIRAAKGDYVVVVCNDTRLVEGHLKNLCGEGYVFTKMEGKDAPFWDGSFYGFPKKIGGLYDERYKTYFGDLDKFYDAKKQGISLTQNPKVRVFHHQSATTNAMGIRNKVYEEDRRVFEKKWGFEPLDNYYNLI